VAIDLITEHIRGKLQQHDLRRIHHNLQVRSLISKFFSQVSCETYLHRLQGKSLAGLKFGNDKIGFISCDLSLKLKLTSRNLYHLLVVRLQFTASRASRARLPLHARASIAVAALQQCRLHRGRSCACCLCLKGSSFKSTKAFWHEVHAEPMI
jgi:hypothetical protein